MTEESECLGCRDQIDGCIIPEFERTICPCKICLIKGMCAEACEDFNTRIYPFGT